MLQEQGPAIPRSSHKITLNSASPFHPHPAQRCLSPSPQRRNKTTCTLNHRYFSSGALNKREREQGRRSRERGRHRIGSSSRL
uniref:Uncharacterized protein n=1 Tax=Suricata suricatta TaxID=37032 RepID=A0A673TVR0_SURSU